MTSISLLALIKSATLYISSVNWHISLIPAISSIFPSIWSIPIPCALPRILDIDLTLPSTCSMGEYIPAWRYSFTIWLNLTWSSSTASSYGFNISFHICISIYVTSISYIVISGQMYPPDLIFTNRFANSLTNS